MKWCNGPCGRELPTECFYSNGQGYLQSRCKGCHRIQKREWARKKYRRDRTWRQAKCASVRASYAARKAA
jgi:hypothetical protein